MASCREKLNVLFNFPSTDWLVLIYFCSISASVADQQTAASYWDGELGSDVFSSGHSLLQSHPPLGSGPASRVRGPNGGKRTTLGESQNTTSTLLAEKLFYPLNLSQSVCESIYLCKSSYLQNNE